MSKLDFESPMAAMNAANERVQRTTLWGVENRTTLGIEKAFGQLKSPYNLPGYTTDTGVIELCSNAGSGVDCVRDPILDTGGKYIAARYQDFSVLMSNGQRLDDNADAGEGNYWEEAVIIIEPAREADAKTDVDKVVVRFSGVAARSLD